TTPYPKAGDPNPIARLGIVSAAGGATRWVDLFTYNNIDPLIVRVGWTPDSKKAVYMIQNREQTWLDLNLADPESAKSQTIMDEESKYWVNVEGIGEPYFLKDGSFLLTNERSGWQHIYHFAADGKLLRQITNGNWDANLLYGVDEAKGYIYFRGTEHSYI